MTDQWGQHLDNLDEIMDERPQALKVWADSRDDVEVELL